MKGKMVLALMIIIWANISWAQKDGREIMAKEEELYNAPNESFTIVMELYDNYENNKASKRKFNLGMRIENVKAEGSLLQKSQILIAEPVVYKGMAVLTKQLSAAETIQKIYIPADKKARTIAGSEKSDKFLTSEITNGDLEPEVLDRWNYELISETEVIDGKTCWVIEAQPKLAQDIKNYGYSKRKIWMRQDNYFIIRLEYYDQQGKLMKIQDNQDLSKIGEYWRAQKMTVKNQQTKKMTVLTFSVREINAKLPADFYSEELFK